jgi:hypothetical protein
LATRPLHNQLGGADVSEVDDELRERAEELVSLWEDGEYEDLKEVVLAARALLDDLPDDTDEQETVTQVLIEATTELKNLAAEDPALAAEVDDVLDD